MFWSNFPKILTPICLYRLIKLFEKFASKSENLAEFIPLYNGATYYAIGLI